MIGHSDGRLRALARSRRNAARAVAPRRRPRHTTDETREARRRLGAEEAELLAWARQAAPASTPKDFLIEFLPQLLAITNRRRSLDGAPPLQLHEIAVPAGVCPGLQGARLHLGPPAPTLDVDEGSAPADGVGSVE